MVKKSLRNGANFLLSTQNTIISAAAVISITYGISAVLGLVRARLLAGYFGASDVLAIFYTADKIPSFIYTILVVGTLSTVFIPVFTGLLKDDEESAWHTASSMISVTVVFFLLMGAIVYIFANPIIKYLALNKFTFEQVALGADLMRYMLLAQIILVMSSFLTSVLQSFKFFLIPALAPVLYNLGMIGGIILLSDEYGIYGPALGVLFGAILHLAIQLPLIKKINFKYKFSLDIKDYGIKQIFGLIPTRIMGAALSQVSGILNNSLAILVSTQSVVVFRFASQLQYFPVLMFGSAIAQASLPTLSYESSPKDRDKFKSTFLTSLHQTMFLVLPVSVVLIILKLPLVRLVYGAASFPWDATVRTSYALAFFSISVFAQSGVYLLNRAFYAMKDTRTPVKVSLFTVIFSLSLSYYFVKYLAFGVWSIALSFSLASILDFILLLYLLDKKVEGFDRDKLLNPFLKISYSALFMGISLYIPMKLLDIGVLDTTRILPLILLTVTTSIIGIVTYLFFTKLFKVDEVVLLYKLLAKVKSKVTPQVQIPSEHLHTN